LNIAGLNIAGVNNTGVDTCAEPSKGEFGATGEGVSSNSNSNRSNNVGANRVKALLGDHFGGSLVNQIISVDPENPHVSQRTEPFHILPLDVRGHDNLDQALEALVKVSDHFIYFFFFLSLSWPKHSTYNGITLYVTNIYIYMYIYIWRGRNHNFIKRIALLQLGF